MIKIYTCQKMTGRKCLDMRREADMLVEVAASYGFKVLNPVIEEGISYIDKYLESVPLKLLEKYWRRDKEMIKESDIILDYRTQNTSDGSNNEVGYSRYCLWKPTVRVWIGKGALISRIEDDLVIPTLDEAMAIIKYKWGTYKKLEKWRNGMWDRCFDKWLKYQNELFERYKTKGD